MATVCPLSGAHASTTSIHWYSPLLGQFSRVYSVCFLHSTLSFYLSKYSVLLCSRDETVPLTADTPKQQYAMNLVQPLQCTPLSALMAVTTSPMMPLVVVRSPPAASPRIVVDDVDEEDEDVDVDDASQRLTIDLQPKSASPHVNVTSVGGDESTMVTSSSHTIHTGAKFATFAEFEAAFERWKTKEFHPFRVASSETLKMPDGSMSDMFKYRYIVYHCAHYGAPRMRG